MSHLPTVEEKTPARLIAHALRRCAAVGLLSLSGIWAGASLAQPVQLVVPYPAGGLVDGLARILAPALGTALGQTIVVENRPGAGGTIGAAYVAKAAPDGRTLLMVFDTYAVNPFLYRLPFDPAKDLAPVGLVGHSPMILVVPVALPVKTLAEFVALAKVRPGQLNYGSTGAGSSNQLAAEHFKQTTGIQLHHIPYKGGAPAITDLIGGRIEAMFVNAGPVFGHIHTGKLKALAVTTRERLESLPDVPSLGEVYPDFEIRSWVALLAPGRTSPQAIEQLNATLRLALTAPTVRAFLHSQAIQPATGSPGQFAAFMRSESERWGAVIRQAHIQVD
jgi:tripartite-type tricarboxylate transporter receptor subunit TctC